MSVLRVVLAILAILAVASWVWTLTCGIPRMMQVFGDLEVSDFPKATLATISFSGFVSRWLIAVLVICGGVAGGLLWLARSPRVSNALSISASAAVGLLAGASVMIASWSVFGAMVSLVEQMQGQGMRTH